MISLALSFFTLFISCSSNYSNLPDGLYADIKTSKGTIIVQLEYQKTPITVANFVSLAEGKNPFVNEKFVNKPFYDGLKFHRVIENFMIQGGDPDGNGSGGPGYKFKDEFHQDLKHDKAGILSMANAGAGTNGSQFFITHKDTKWLDNRHSVFGHVVQGQDVVNTIAMNDVIEKITIVRIGKEAKKFDAVKTFKTYFDEEVAAQKLLAEKTAKVRTEKAMQIAAVKQEGTTTPSGLMYKIIEKGNGNKPAKGATVYVNYAGYLENGDLFDTSIEPIAQAFGKWDANRAHAKQYIPLSSTVGNHKFIPGFAEGLDLMNIGDKYILYIPSNLGYGAQGAGNVIPPNANIVFEVELLEKMPTQDK